MKIPCKDCQNRKFGCHKECVKYSKYRIFQDEVNAKRRKEKEAIPIDPKKSTWVGFEV